MRYLSVCSGIEAATVAWHGLGWLPVGLSEIEPFPAAVLKHHYPGVPNLGDMTKFKEWEVDAFDILVGGTPCQAFSVAGLRRSLDDNRGNLSLIFCEMADHFGPSYVLWENVPGVLNTKDNAFGCFLAGLAGEDDALVAPGGKWTDAGFVLGPKRNVAWRVLDAQYFGLAQRRRRVFVVACPRDGADPCEILFEPEGVQRHSAPSREKGERFTHDVAPCLRAGGNRTGGDRPYGTDVDTCDSLQPVAFHPTQDPIHSADGSCHALGCGSKGGAATHAVAFDTTQITSSANYSNPKPGDPRHPLAAGAHVPAIARTLQARHDSSACHDSGMDVVATHMRVRRLTPVECERLQGFPDGYTDIPWRRGKLDAFMTGEDCPDGPRYKALGNSMAVPVMRWIGERINKRG